MLLAGGRSRIQYRCTVSVCTTSCVFDFTRLTRKNHMHCWCRTVRVTPDRLPNACSASFLVNNLSLRPLVHACVSLLTRVRTLCFHQPHSSYTKVEDACVGLVNISVVCCVATTTPFTLERLFVALHSRTYQPSAPSRPVIVPRGSPLTTHQSHIYSRSVELCKGNYNS